MTEKTLVPEQPPYMNSYLGDGERPIDYKRYIFLVQKNFYFILVFFIITATLAAIYTSSIPDYYAGFSQMIIEKPRGNYSRTAEYVGDSEAQSDDYYRTQMEILRSPKILRDVIVSLNLKKYFGIDNETVIINMMRKKMVDISRIRASRLINVKTISTDPKLAANLANEVTRTYIRESFESSLYHSKEILNWLPDDNESSDVVTIQTPYGGMKQISKAQLVDSLPAIQSDQTIRELRQKKIELESELDLELRKYRDKHPVIVKKKSSLVFLEQSIKAEKERIIDELRSKAEGRHKIVNARIIQEATIPSFPIPSKRLALFVVITLGELFASILLIILFDFFDDTIMSVEDMERKGVLLPFLGPVALIKGKYVSDAQKSLSSFHEKHVGIAESFRYLRVAINFSASPEDSQR